MMSASRILFEDRLLKRLAKPVGLLVKIYNIVHMLFADAKIISSK